MERRILRCPLRALLLSFTIVVWLLSCASPAVQVLYGNYRHSKGEYAQATINYFRALESVHRRPFVQYDLGNVYRALGEAGVANDAFRSAVEESGDQELVFRAYFNLGLISYEDDDYRQAVEYFIQALRVEPNDWDTKVNLELALRNLGQEPERQVKPQPASQPGPLEESFQEILDTIKKQEEAVWQSAISQPADAAGNDW